MTNFKITFPTGYQYTDLLNDNLDIHVIVENGDVYFGIAITIANVQYFLGKDDEPFFWGNDMLIVKDLSRLTLAASVALLLERLILDKVFSKIGRLGDNEFYEGLTFDDISNWGSLISS